jgi:4'-phosphopantetheinyl transferase
MERIDSGEIHLWLCFHESICDPALLNRYLELLSVAELRQQRRFYFERDQHRYLVTRALVRTVLSKYAPISPDQWRFATNPYGRPEVANEDAHARLLAFNLSHTSGLIILGVTRNRAIGVDVENLHVQRAGLEVADRFFALSEVAALRALPLAQQERRFFEYWTLKESYIKAHGMGLSLPLNRFAFDVEDRGRIRLSIDSSLKDLPELWESWQFEPEAGFIVAVVAARPDGGSGSLRFRRTVPLLHEEAFDCRSLRNSATPAACAHGY